MPTKPPSKTALEAKAIVAMWVSRFKALAPLNRSSPEFAEEVAQLAGALVVQEGEGEATHWDEGAKLLLGGLIAFLVQNKPDAVLPEIGRILGQTEEELGLTLEAMQAAGGLPGTAAALLLNAGRNERGSFVTTALRNTQWLDTAV